MNPHYPNDSMNLAMDRNPHEQFYSQELGNQQWPPGYMQNAMMSQNPAMMAYYSQGGYSSQEALQQMASQAYFRQMNIDERKPGGERLGSVTPGETSSPVASPYDGKADMVSSQYPAEMLQYMSAHGSTNAMNYNRTSPRLDRGMSNSPEKRNSPSVSYGRTQKMPTPHYPNEVNHFMGSPPENINYSGAKVMHERLSTGTPESRNSPAVTSPYEVKQASYPTQYENEMMKYVAQINKVSNPSYVEPNHTQDAVTSAGPSQSVNGPSQTVSNPSQTLNEASRTITNPSHTVNDPTQTLNCPSYSPAYDTKSEQPQYTNEMLQYLSAQQKLGHMKYDVMSGHESVGTPEQRDSPSLSSSPYMVKPEMSSAQPPALSSSPYMVKPDLSSAQPPALSSSPYMVKPEMTSAQPPNQMLQYMAAQSRDLGMNVAERDKVKSPADLSTFEVKQEIQPAHCSQGNLNYEYSQSQVNSSPFSSASPKLEPRKSPFDNGLSSIYPDIKPEMQSNMNLYPYGGFSSYPPGHLPAGQARPQYPGNMPVQYYHQGPYPGSHFSGHPDDKSRMMLQQQQYYGQPYSSSYEMAVNSQQRYLQQGMMGNQWQSMPPNNYGQMVGYGKRKNVENGDNLMHMAQKKSRGYNDEDYDFELCNTWDEVTKVTDENSSNETAEGEVNGGSKEVEKLSVRTIFNYQYDESLSEVAHRIILAERRLCEDLKRINFKKPILHIYNPLVYAFETHLDFVRRFCTTKKSVLFLGMNPGPFGMSQNGIPFGEVGIVRDWFNIRGQIHKPSREHHKRQIMGLQCQRSEVSGSRFWGLFKSICGTPENFFKHCFVYNICPMAFISPTSKNITPAQLPVRERTLLYNACNAALLEVMQTLEAKMIVAIGKFAEGQAMMVANDAKLTDINVQSILHPSPINPAANRGWESAVLQQLKDMDVMKYFLS